MAYNIYVYAEPGNGIKCTHVTSEETGEVLKTIYEGDSDEGKESWYMNTIDGDNGEGITGNVKFTAVLDRGMEFVHFVYRVGSTSATRRYETSNPFIYTEGQDIHIWALADAPMSTPSVYEFNWFSSNGSATAEQTERAYNALVNKGKLKDFSYLVWNDMVDKLYEVIKEEGYSWDSSSSKTTTLAKTKMTATDKKITALRFNSFASNMVGYGLPQWSWVKIGDPIIGQDFLDLIDALNRYIRAYHS